MNLNLRSGALAVAVIVSAAGAAQATIYDQGTVTVSGGVTTDVDVFSNSVALPWGRTIYLTLDSGALVQASWDVYAVWEALWWEQVGQDQFVINGNEYLLPTTLGSNDQQQPAFSPGHYLDAATTLTPTLATFRLSDHSAPFDVCGSDPHAIPLYQNCAEFVLSQQAVLDSFTVRTDHDFTWTLSDVAPAPEPATWGLMIAGLGLVGAALRRSPVRSPA